MSHPPAKCERPWKSNQSSMVRSSFEVQLAAMSFWSNYRLGTAINKRVWLGLTGGGSSSRQRRVRLASTAIHVLITIFVASCRLTECIRTTRIHAESDSSRLEALLGSNLTLRCPFELEGNDQLYSIKWHKKLNGTFFEFYSYISSPHETIHHKTLPGINVDLEQSRRNGEKVKLLKVNLDTEGIFRCVATTDEVFQVVRQELNVVVFIPAQQAPTIVATRRTFGIGERVHLTCTTGPSRPIAKINWFINDIPVPQSYIRPTGKQYAPTSCSPEVSPNQSEQQSPTDEELDNEWKEKQIGPTSSELDFTLRHEHLNESHFTVRCSSLMSAKFIPDERNSTVEFGAWQSNSPVIVGLQEEYDLGDWVQLNCTVPAFQAEQSDSLSRSSKIEWYINGQRADRKWLVHYFTYGNIGLRFQLELHHLADDESLSIKCVSVQMWPFDKIAHPTPYIESLEEEKPRKVDRQRKTRPKPTKPTEIVIVNQRKVPQHTETAAVSTEPSLTVEPDMPINGTGSMLNSIRQFGENHPQLITSLRLTLIPIAVVGALFAFL